MARKKKKYDFTTYEAATRLRSDWGNVKPATVVFPDKTKYTRKEKHKKKISEE